VSLSKDVYWVSNTKSKLVHKHSLTTDSLLSTIITATSAHAMALTLDEKFLLVASADDDSTGVLQVLDTQSGLVVGTGSQTATEVTVCDDGTIVTASRGVGGLVATYTIDSVGALTETANGDADRILNTACSPGSAFVVLARAFGQKLHSVAITALGTIVDTINLTATAVSVVFNPATSDVFVLFQNGALHGYGFDSNTGMFGNQFATTTTESRNPAPGIEYIQFANDKLFVYVGDLLKTYDTNLNELTSNAITTGCVCSAR
jgi:hypothetical protein